jgi:hypothetical protein
MPVKLEATFIGDICGAIEASRSYERQVTFVLTDKQQIGIIPAEQTTFVAHKNPNMTTLKAVILSGSALEESRQGPILPLKLRMLLLLTLSSNMLQLFQTRWLERPWSKDVVQFMVQQGTVDIVRPYISLTIDDTTPNHPQPKVELKLALLELGILLLEIWHEMTFETQFSLTREAPTGYYDRLILAIRWFHDESNPLPELYEKAVSHCLYRPVGCEFLDREDNKLWGAVCNNVIQPLSRICKQWT